jgi:hypothetical protein
VGKHTHHARPELQHRRDEPADGGAPAGDSAQTHVSLLGNVASSWGPVLDPLQHAGASTYRFTRRSCRRRWSRAVQELGCTGPPTGSSRLRARLTSWCTRGGTTGVTIAFRGSAVCVFQWRFGMPAAGTYDPRDFFRSGSVTPTHLRQEPIVTSAVCNFDSADVLGGCGASGGERDAPV